MTWVQVFAVFIVSHGVGDFMLQTEWQALHKRGGLSGSPISRRALITHVSTYTIAFVPAFVWLWGRLGPSTIGIAALIAIPHLIQDDGRLLGGYARAVKGADLDTNIPLAISLDQAFHLVAMFLVALLAAH